MACPCLSACHSKCPCESYLGLFSKQPEFVLGFSNCVLRVRSARVTSGSTDGAVWPCALDVLAEVLKGKVSWWLKPGLKWLDHDWGVLCETDIRLKILQTIINSWSWWQTPYVQNSKAKLFMDNRYCYMLGAWLISHSEMCRCGFLQATWSCTICSPSQEQYKALGERMSSSREHNCKPQTSSLVKCSSVDSIGKQSSVWVEVYGTVREKLSQLKTEWVAEDCLRSIMGRIEQSWLWCWASSSTPSLFLTMFILPRLLLPRNDPRLVETSLNNLHTKASATADTIARSYFRCNDVGLPIQFLLFKRYSNCHHLFIYNLQANV